MRLEDFLKLDLKVDSRNRIDNGSRTDDIHTIQKLLKRPDTNIGRLLDTTCNNCNEKEVYCGQTDLGLTDHYYNFWHICLNCLDAYHVEKFSCAGSERKTDADCPYCKTD